MSSFPNIDPLIKYVGVSSLRKLNALKLASLGDVVLVFQESDIPIAVLVSYERYQNMCEHLRTLLDHCETLSVEYKRAALNPA